MEMILALDLGIDGIPGLDLGWKSGNLEGDPIPALPFPKGIAQVVLVGHDWGGAVAWNVALFYPERLRAVASLNTPYRPADPDTDIVEKMKSIPTFDYQFYFQEPGVAEAELEKDIGRTLKILIRSTSPE
ncbi:PREDICTED: bifunctional epoxide hydrolase 2-like, partial [Sturnus vulgaris]|uniref:bifunctional epoxide hydrolase 2-like n=1 Tax=Sturnus vulgaris TaxID=9172 RepID=UPI00071A380F